MQLDHPWKIHGYAPPFKLVGFCSIPSTSLAEHNPEAYRAQLRLIPLNCGVGSCGVCGMVLTNNFIIEDAAGKRFSVGCDCVEKHGGTKLITEVTAKKKALDKAKRAEKSRIKREARQAEYNSAMDEQRNRNGGMTDYELAEHNRKIECKKRSNEVADITRPIADILCRQEGDFCLSILRQLSMGSVSSLSVRAIEIIDRICKKNGFMDTTLLIEKAKLIENQPFVNSSLYKTI